MTQQKFGNLGWAGLHIAPAIALFGALLRWPYSYYMALRVVVLASAVLIIWFLYERYQRATAWVVVFGLIALIFNPIFPVRMSRDVWQLLNIVGGGLFVAHLAITLRER